MYEKSDSYHRIQDLRPDYPDDFLKTVVQCQQIQYFLFCLDDCISFEGNLPKDIYANAISQCNSHSLTREDYEASIDDLILTLAETLTSELADKVTRRQNLLDKEFQPKLGLMPIDSFLSPVPQPPLSVQVPSATTVVRDIVGANEARPGQPTLFDWIQPQLKVSPTAKSAPKGPSATTVVRESSFCHEFKSRDPLLYSQLEIIGMPINQDWRVWQKQFIAETAQ